MPESNVPRYRFADFLLDPGERRLLRDGIAIPLTPRAFDTLLYLVERPGRLVGKTEFMTVVWSDACVEDGNLSRVVHILRRTLADKSDGRDLIETVPKQGYRFVAAVSVVDTQGDPAPTGALHAAVRFKVRPRTVAVAIAAGTLVGSTALWVAQRPDPTTHPQVHTVNGEAFTEFRAGRLYIERQREGDADRALAHFDAALALDPQFASAQAGKADASIFRYWDTGAHDDIAQARRAIEEALRADEHNSYAHTVSCRIRAAYDWAFAAAERECRRAVALDPTDHEARRELAFLLNSRGRKTEALTEMEAAIALAPTSFNKRSRGMLLYFSGRLDEAIAQFRQIEATDPEFRQASLWLARCLEQTGEHAAALEALTRARADQALRLREAFATGGWPAVLRATLPVDPHGYSLEAAESHAQLGEIDAAFATLNRMIEARRVNVLHIDGDPRLRPLREDPRFAAILRRIGLPFAG